MWPFDLIYRYAKIIRGLVKHGDAIFDETLWNEFKKSLDIPKSHQPENDTHEGHYNYKYQYVISNTDLPIFRDLKSLLNMVHAAERLTEKQSLWALTIFNSLKVPSELYQLKINYQIFMSTNSVVTRELQLATNQFIENVLPKLSSLATKFITLLTVDNLGKLSDVVIENVIRLEQYQQEHKEEKRLANKTTHKDEEPKDDRINEIIKKNQKKEGVFTALAKGADDLLRYVYKENFTKHFYSDEKREEKSKDDSFVYFMESKDHRDTEKHLVKLRNGLVGIKKSLDDYETYSTGSGIWASVSNISTFVGNLKRAYYELKEFNAKSIFAEQSGPLADKIKLRLKQLYGYLEKIACRANYYEDEFCFKEGLLLDRFVTPLIERYNEITSELKIPIDYKFQKKSFIQSRIASRKNRIQNIESDIDSLNPILEYKNTPFSNMSRNALTSIRDYILKYEDDISIDRDTLATIKIYINELINPDGGIKSFFKNQLDKLAHRFNIGSQITLMKSFENRRFSLYKQKDFITYRINMLTNQVNAKKYDYFNSTELDSKGIDTCFMAALSQRTKELKKECENLDGRRKALVESISKDDQIRNELKQRDKEHIEKMRQFNDDMKKILSANVTDSKVLGDINKRKEELENEGEELENKILEMRAAKAQKFVARRLNRQYELRINEYKLFTNKSTEFEQKKNIQEMVKALTNENTQDDTKGYSLSPESFILIDEMKEVSNMSTLFAKKDNSTVEQQQIEGKPTLSSIKM